MTSVRGSTGSNTEKPQALNLPCIQPAFAMQHYISTVAVLLTLAQASLLQPEWIMSGNQNLTRAPTLVHPSKQQLPGNEYLHFTPSERGRETVTDIPEAIFPYLPSPGFWTCPHNTALPPNTGDCVQVITDTFDAYRNTTIDIPQDRCIQASYRSCLIYTCSSPCEGLEWDMDEWNQLAIYLQSSCVWGKGGGGYMQKLPGGKDEKPPYRLGMTHIDGADKILTPPIVC